MADIVIHWEFQRCVKTMRIGIDREISWWRRNMNLLTSEQGLAKRRGGSSRSEKPCVQKGESSGVQFSI